MKKLLTVENVIHILPDGSRLFQPLSFIGNSGETIIIQGSEQRRSILFEILCGITPPNGGCVYFNNSNLYNLPASHRALIRVINIGAIPENAELFQDMSVMDNLIIPQLIMGRSKKNAIQNIVELSDKAGINLNFNRSPKTLTSYQLAISLVLRVFSTSPEILLFNNFLDNLNDKDKEKTKKIITSLISKKNLLIYMSSDNVETKHSKHIIL